MAIDLSELSVPEKKKPSGKQSSLQEMLSKDISFFRKKLEDKKKEALYLELSILLSAGVDIKSSLEIITAEQKKKKDKELFENIQQRILKGSALSEAMEVTGMFSSYEIFSLKIGEETGKISTILHELSLYFKNKIKQKRQAISALTYPLIVLSTSVAVLTFMLNVIVPMFTEVFKRFGGELPFLTRMVIRASDFFGDYFWMGLFILLGTSAVFFTQKEKLWFRKGASSFLLRVPILGELIRKIFLARFCHSMNLLLSSRIPLLRALGLVKQMIRFYPLESAIESIEKDILQGLPLYKSLSQHPVFHHRLVSLVKVGEEVNKLDEFFAKISDQYTEDIDHQTKVLSTFLEPLMLVFLGLIVGIILVAMYLPMFQLGSFF